MWKCKEGRRFQTVEGPRRGLFHYCRTTIFAKFVTSSNPFPSPWGEKLHKKCRRGRERGDGEVWGEPSSCEPPQYVMDIDLQTPGSGRWPISAQLPTQLTQLTNHSPASPLSWHSWPTIAQKWQSLGQWIAKPFLHCVQYDICSTALNTSLSWAWDILFFKAAIPVSQFIPCFEILRLFIKYIFMSKGSLISWQQLGETERWGQLKINITVAPATSLRGVW